MGQQNIPFDVSNQPTGIEVKSSDSNDISNLSKDGADSDHRPTTDNSRVVATTSLESNKSYEEVKSLDENKNTLNLNENKDTLDDKETTYGINSNISDVNQKDSCGSADMQEECDQVVDTLLKTPTPISVEEDVTELDSTLQSYDSELKKPTDM